MVALNQDLTHFAWEREVAFRQNYQLHFSFLFYKFSDLTGVALRPMLAAMRPFRFCSTKNTRVRNRSLIWGALSGHRRRHELQIQIWRGATKASAIAGLPLVDK
jgi:hypothetical protein